VSKKICTSLLDTTALPGPRLWSDRARMAFTSHHMTHETQAVRGAGRTRSAVSEKER
jgi:hypothetical protein